MKEKTPHTGKIMYVSPNFPSKKALKTAVANGERVTVFQPNDMFGNSPPQSGSATIEGPHYPKPHRQVTIVDGQVATVK